MDKLAIIDSGRPVRWGARLISDWNEQSCILATCGGLNENKHTGHLFECLAPGWRAVGKAHSFGPAESGSRVNPAPTEVVIKRALLHCLASQA